MRNANRKSPPTTLANREKTRNANRNWRAVKYGTYIQFDTRPLYLALVRAGNLCGHIQHLFGQFVQSLVLSECVRPKNGRGKSVHYDLRPQIKPPCNALLIAIGIPLYPHR